MNKGGRPKLALDVPALVAAYENGLSLRQLGEQFNCGYITARRRLVEAGVTMRPNGRRRGSGSGTDYSAAIEAYEQGATLETAAALVGRTGARLWQVMRQRGKPRRARGRKR